MLDVCQLISDVTRAVPELKQDALIERGALYIDTLIKIINKLVELCSDSIPAPGEKASEKFKMSQTSVELLVSSLRYLDGKVEKDDLKKNSSYLQQIAQAKKIFSSSRLLSIL
jgi:hypothetical protein